MSRWILVGGAGLTGLQIAEKLISMKISKSNSFQIGKRAKIKFVKDRPGHDFRYALDSKKILNKLKWKPKVDINCGLQKTVFWYLNNISYFNEIPIKLISKRFGLKND